MIPLQQARDAVLQGAQGLGHEGVSLADAVGRVLAETVVAPVSVPPFRASAMDGFAVQAADLASGEATLHVLGAIMAGQVPASPVTAGSCYRIMTGAPLPLGADAVVLIEQSEAAGPNHVRLVAQTHPGRYVRDAGHDVRQGQTVMGPGAVLGPAHVGRLASMGRTQVRVARKPVVALLVTGTEVVRPGQPLRPGAIYSSNHLTLRAYAEAAGAEVVDLGPVADDPDALLAALQAGLAYDALITTGGVSMGDHDLMPGRFAAAGVQKVFHKIRMKPGKPVWFGRHGQTPVFGLPGNPVSSAVTFLQLVHPWIRACQGDPQPELPVVEAVAGESFHGRPGRLRLERVHLSTQDGRWIAHTTGGQSSAMLSSLMVAEGLLWIEADQRGPAAGDPVRVQLLSTRGLPSGWWA